MGLRERLKAHKTDSGRVDSKIYKRMNECPESWIIHPFEGKVCTKEEADNIEQNYINVLKPSLNTYNAISKKHEPDRKYKYVYNNKKQHVSYFGSRRFLYNMSRRGFRAVCPWGDTQKSIIELLQDPRVYHSARGNTYASEREYTRNLLTERKLTPVVIANAPAPTIPVRKKKGSQRR